MKKFPKKISNIFLKLIVSSCSLVIGVCIFVANNSTNICLPLWAYEVDMPQSIKDNC